VPVIGGDKIRIMLYSKKGLVWSAVYWSQLGIMWNSRLTWILQLDKVMKNACKAWIHTMHWDASTLNRIEWNPKFLWPSDISVTTDRSRRFKCLDVTVKANHAEGLISWDCTSPCALCVVFVYSLPAS
jgi:hypothetical protein